MILHIIGARPNFIKAAPVIRELRHRNIDQLVVHTSQHSDRNMSDDIIEEIGMNLPDIYLAANEAKGMERITFLMSEIFNIINEHSIKLVVVYGDVDSTLAGALATVKTTAKLAHVESGLRSFDNTMPEEINRRIVDEIADMCFVTESSGITNLKHRPSKVFLVGNTMIDTLVWVQQKGLLNQKIDSDYVLLTMHRPSNVDSEKMLNKILEMCRKIKTSIVWPLHPRTKTQMEKYNIYRDFLDINNLKTIQPLTYIPFLNYLNNSNMIITDSGGVQEESTFLHIPCFTVRKNTERPITIELGTNRLVDIEQVPAIIKDYKAPSINKATRPPLWDGVAAKRIVNILLSDK